MVIYTIDVVDVIDSLIPDKELIINGTFEDGTEVKQYKNSSTLNKPYSDYYFDHGLSGEYCAGVHFSGGHPFSQLGYNPPASCSQANPWSGGNIIYKSCNYQSINPNLINASILFHSIDSCIDSHWFNPLPKPVNQLNERYRRLRPGHHFFTLKDSIQACSQLLFNIDICYRDTFYHPILSSIKEGFVLGDTLKFKIEFISNPYPDPEAVVIYYYKEFYDIIDTLSDNCSVPIWNHFSDTIDYCASKCKYIRLINSSSLDPQDQNSMRKSFLFIDNHRSSQKY